MGANGRDGAEQGGSQQPEPPKVGAGGPLGLPERQQGPADETQWP